VPSHEFLFAVRLSGRPEAAMLDDLTATILKFVGCAAAVKEISAGLAAGVGDSRPGAAGSFDVQFRAHAGELEVVVSRGDQRIWQTSRRLT
jgi:hypothetical protein